MFSIFATTTKYFLDIALTVYTLAFFSYFLFMLEFAIDKCIYFVRIFVNYSIFHQQNLGNLCSFGEDAEMTGCHNDSFLELSNK